MGLDMYLKGKRYVSEWHVKGDDDRAERISNEFDELRNSGITVNQVEAQVAYWRKVNQVHGWFVSNVQFGKDDCGSYDVSRDDLRALRNACEKVLETGDTSLLPRTQGFFFGSDDVDEDYFEDLRYTISQLDRALAMPESWDFEYQSSW